MEEDGSAQRELEALTAGAAAKQRDFETRKKARLTGGGAGDHGARGARAGPWQPRARARQLAQS